MPIEQWLAFYPEDRSRLGHSPPGREAERRYVREWTKSDGGKAYTVRVPGYPSRTFCASRFGGTDAALASALAFRDAPHHERPFKAGPIRGNP